VGRRRHPLRSPHPHRLPESLNRTRLDVPYKEVRMPTFRSQGWPLRRPLGAIAGRELAGSVLLVLAIAAGSALLMQSVGLGLAIAALGMIPLWWSDHERLADRFRVTLLLGGLAAAVDLYFTVMR